MSRTISNVSQESACLGECLQQIRTTSRPQHPEATLPEEDVISPVDRQTAIQNEAAEPYVEESLEARIERLGRERPKIFRTIWAEIAFIFSISMSQILCEYFISGFNVIIPTLVIKLNIPTEAAVWPASAFSLVVASTLLVFGRLADMFGGKAVFVFGLAWLLLWSIIAGFSRNQLMLDFCRALQGIGPAAFLPSGVMLMGSIYRPGPRKNLIFSIYGTCAVVGFFTGIFFSGVVGEYLRWGWYFWIGALMAVFTAVTAYLAVPSDYEEKRKLDIKMDWMGALFIVSGLVLFVFAVTESSHAPDGWRTPYVYVLLIVGCALLGIAVYIEGWVAQAPLLPFDLFCVPHMKALLIALFLLYGCFGIYLLYGTLYMQNIMGATPLQVVAWFTPMITGGLILSTLGGFVLHIIPGTVILIISGLGWVGAALLFAVAPQGANFWAFVFPSMICATIGIDLTYNISNIFITSNMPNERQGLAGALINSVLHLGIATLLGFSDVTQAGIARFGLKKSYQAVFWFEVGCSALALLILVVFVRLESARSEMTVDEKREVRTVEKTETK